MMLRYLPVFIFRAVLNSPGFVIPAKAGFKVKQQAASRPLPDDNVFRVALIVSA